MSRPCTKDGADGGMPYVYVLILFSEAVVLGWIYATRAPLASEPLSVYVGWGAFISMVSLLCYSFARRSRRLRGVMKLSSWLYLHIYLALQAGLLVVFHCYHLFGRAQIQWLNPGVLNLMALGVVLCSGVFGRYLYAWLPRSASGVQLRGEEIDRELGELGTDVPAQAVALLREAGVREAGSRTVEEAPGFFGLVRADLRTRRALRQLRGLQLLPAQQRLLERRVRLERQRMVFRAASRVFQLWIVLHRPMAGVLYVLSIVHIVLSYMFTPNLGR